MNLLRLHISRFLILTVITFNLYTFSFAQEITVNARVDTNNILIGDWIRLTLEAKHPADIKISLPKVPDSLQGFEVVDVKQPIIQAADQNKITRQDLIITAFDSGIYQIPAFEFQYLKQGSAQPMSILTTPVNIYVSTIPVDTSQTIKDIKLPLEKKITLAEMLPYIIAGAIALLAVILICYYFMRKKKKMQPIVSVEPLLPPHKLAIKALRKLEESRIWQQGKTKEYYTRLTDILRIYLEQQFQINAMELTTDEIMYKLVFSNVNKELQNSLEQIMRLADLVKFAKKLTTPGNNESCIETAYLFVKNTIPQETLIKEEVTT